MKRVTFHAFCSNKNIYEENRILCFLCAKKRLWRESLFAIFLLFVCKKISKKRVTVHAFCSNKNINEENRFLKLLCFLYLWNLFKRYKTSPISSLTIIIVLRRGAVPLGIKKVLVKTINRHALQFEKYNVNNRNLIQQLLT